MLINKVEICGVNTSKLPLLTNDEKKLLFERIKKGDQEAREIYIKGNLRLVLSVIKRFSSSSENADDLFQIGCIGLMKAIDNFDCTMDVKFLSLIHIFLLVSVIIKPDMLRSRCLQHLHPSWSAVLLCI